MTKENKKRFQSSSKCNICNELYSAKDNQVKYHCPVKCKYSDSANKSSYVNFGSKYKSCYSVVLHSLEDPRIAS